MIADYKRLTALIVFLVLSTGGAQAVDSSLPPEQETSEAGVAGEPAQAEADTSSSDLPPGASDTDSPAGQEATSNPPDQAELTTTTSKASVAGSKPKVFPGPLEAERAQVLSQIKIAGENGVGVKGYMTAFNYVEDLVAKGASEEKIKGRLIPIVTALADQMKRKEKIKSAREAKAKAQAQTGFGPGGILAPKQDIPMESRMYGGMGGGDTRALIDQIMQKKFGGKMPAGLTPDMIQNQFGGKLPAGVNADMLRNKLKDPRIQQIIKRYKGQ